MVFFGGWGIRDADRDQHSNALSFARDWNGLRERTKRKTRALSLQTWSCRVSFTSMICAWMFRPFQWASAAHASTLQIALGNIRRGRKFRKHSKYLITTNRRNVFFNNPPKSPDTSPHRVCSLVQVSYRFVLAIPHHLLINVPNNCVQIISYYVHKG